MESKLIECKDALFFMLAGKALFTLRSKLTNNRFTFYVEQARDKKPIYFVSLLTGQNNETDYTYIGFIKVTDGYPVFSKGAKGNVAETATSFLAFNHVFKHLSNNENINTLEIWHEGYCCRCGRLLTTPESVDRGIGPECIKLINKEKIYHA